MELHLHGQKRPFDAHSVKLTTVAVESFGDLSESAEERANQLGADVVGAVDGGDVMRTERPSPLGDFCGYVGGFVTAGEYIV